MHGGIEVVEMYVAKVSLVRKMPLVLFPVSGSGCRFRVRGSGLGFPDSGSGLGVKVRV